MGNGRCIENSTVLNILPFSNVWSDQRLDVDADQTRCIYNAQKISEIKNFVRSWTMSYSYDLHECQSMGNPKNSRGFSYDVTKFGSKTSIRDYPLNIASLEYALVML